MDIGNAAGYGHVVQCQQLEVFLLHPKHALQDKEIPYGQQTFRHRGRQDSLKILLLEGKQAAEELLYLARGLIQRFCIAGGVRFCNLLRLQQCVPKRAEEFHHQAHRVSSKLAIGKGQVLFARIDGCILRTLCVKVLITDELLKLQNHFLREVSYTHKLNILDPQITVQLIIEDLPLLLIGYAQLAGTANLVHKALEAFTQRLFPVHARDTRRSVGPECLVNGFVEAFPIDRFPFNPKLYIGFLHRRDNPVYLGLKQNIVAFCALMH